MINSGPFTKLKEIVNSICEELNNIHLSPAWVISTIVVTIAAIIRFCFFLFEIGKCNYWNISTSAIEVSERNIFDFIYLISYAILLIIYTVVLHKTNHFLFGNKNKLLMSIVVTVVLNIALFLILFSFVTILVLDIKISFQIAIIIHIECILSGFIFFRKKKENKKKEISDLIIFAILVPIMIILIVNIGYRSQEDINRFKLFENGYVAVYENSNRLYLEKYDSNSNSINKNKQKVIENKNIEYEIIEIDILKDSK